MAQFDSSNPQATLELGRIIGAKPPLKPKHVLGIRQQLKTSGKIRDLPLFSCAVDAKLRGCDLVKLRVSDVAPGGVLRHEQQSSSRKQGGPFRSRSPSRRGRRCQRGWRVAASAGTIGCFRADRAPATTSAPASTHVWSASGSRRSTWSPTPTAHQPPAEKRGARLQEDRQPTRLPAAARPSQAGEHGPLSRHRGGRRLGTVGAD